MDRSKLPSFASVEGKIVDPIKILLFETCGNQAIFELRNLYVFWKQDAETFLGV